MKSSEKRYDARWGEERTARWREILEHIGLNCEAIPSDLCELSAERLRLAAEKVGIEEEYVFWIDDTGLPCYGRDDVSALARCFHGIHGPDSLWIDSVMENAAAALRLTPSDSMRSLLLDNSLEAVQIALDRIDPEAIPYNVMVRAYHVRALLGSVLERSPDIQFTEGGEDK